MSYGYGGQQNPFDDRAAANYSQYGSNVEMSSLPQGGSADPNAILNECRDIDKSINTIDQNLGQMRMFQQRTLDDADSSASSSSNRQLDNLSTETMALYRSLTERVRMVKSNPDSNLPKNSAQVQRVDRRLKEAIRAYQSNESDFRKKTQEQMARQYRIVRPDADESEVQAAVQDPTGGQVFQQALMQSNRRGQAQSVLSAVQDRQAQLQKIEQQLIELAQLFQDMDTLVVQQEAAVTNIEQKAEETVENFDKGNQEVETAIGTARATRKKKWWCLLIAVIIIVIIVVAVVAYVMVNKPKEAPAAAPAKRSLKLFRGQTVALEGRAWDESNPIPQVLTARTETKQGIVKDIEDPEAWLATLVTREDKPVAKRWVDSTKKFVPEARALPPALGHVFVSVDDEEK